MLSVRFGRPKRVGRVGPVEPSLDHVQASARKPSMKRITKIQMLGSWYNWAVWVFIITMILSQFLSVVWDTVETDQHLVYGQSPTLGPYSIGGSNDEPYTDRAIVCVTEVIAWYEDQTAEKWYSDVISSDQKSALGIPQRQFNTLTGDEMDCIHSSDCDELPVTDHWGSKFSTTDQAMSITSIAISNGNRFGLFLYDQPSRRFVTSVYDWATLISNVFICLLLSRWMFAVYALQFAYFQGESNWHNAGIGCLANSRSFNLLPIVLLPRLHMVLSAFWTVGCEFEGEQKGLSEAWFAMYPAILELVLLQFSLLNFLAKVVRHRIPDWPFGPSIIIFCLMHRFRLEIAQSEWFGIDGRVTPLVLSTEFEQLRLVDMFTTDVGFRLNGNVKSLIVVKLVVLGLNFVPLLWNVMRPRSVSSNTTAASGIEKALAIRADNVGGLGRSASTDAYEMWSEGADHCTVGLNSYELVRLGYVVFGGRFVISFDDWEVVTMLSPLQRFYHLWNHRVTLLTLRDAAWSKYTCEHIQMCRLDDPRFLQTESRRANIFAKLRAAGAAAFRIEQVHHGVDFTLQFDFEALVRRAVEPSPRKAKITSTG
ncbi:hypothetical protein FI667_g9539, partial [Globisporangium splendens]